MKSKLLFRLTAFVLLLSSSMSPVYTQSLIHGFKPHRRGHGAVELLLATGIIAKLLNHRAKHGVSLAGRHILQTLLGGHRYPPQQHTRFPLEMHSIHPAILQEDLLDPQTMSALGMNDADLIMNQESALLGVRSPLLMGQENALLGARSPLLMGQENALLGGRSPMIMGQESSLLGVRSPMIMGLSDSSLLAAEAQLSQQLLAARRARRLLEARKYLAAQEAQQMLAAQSEVNSMLAAQDMHNPFLTADQSRQVFTSIAPPRSMQQKLQNMRQPVVNFASNAGQATGSFIGSQTPPQYQGMNSFGQLNSVSQASNFQGSPVNTMMGSESVQNSQSIVYSQPSPVYTGPSQSSSSNEASYSSAEGNYQNTAMNPGNYQGNAMNQGNYQGNAMNQGNYQGSSMNQGNYQSSSMTPGNYQGSSMNQGNYQGSSMNQGNYQSNSQAYYNGKSAPQGSYNGYSARKGNTYNPSGKNASSGQKKSNIVTPAETRELPASSRSDEELTVVSDTDIEDAKKIVSSLEGML